MTCADLYCDRAEELDKARLYLYNAQMVGSVSMMGEIIGSRGRSYWLALDMVVLVLYTVNSSGVRVNFIWCIAD